MTTDSNRIISLSQRIIKWIITKFCFFEYLIFVCMNSDQSYENNVCFRIWNKEDFLYDYFSITEYSSFQKIKYDQYLSVSLCVKKFIFKSWILNLKFKFWKDFYMLHAWRLGLVFVPRLHQVRKCNGFSTGKFWQRTHSSFLGSEDSKANAGRYRCRVEFGPEPVDSSCGTITHLRCDLP